MLGWSASVDGRPSVAPRVKTICGTSRFNEAAARGAGRTRSRWALSEASPACDAVRRSIAEIFALVEPLRAERPENPFGQPEGAVPLS